mmetsp:Transcript_10901/g.13763  ORF Transcript_10901/g.13763 Transcript_10901/m.13763 type:complete len:103 (+) Transcript_10901:714-1022(+)
MFKYMVVAGVMGAPLSAFKGHAIFFARVALSLKVSLLLGVEALEDVGALDEGVSAGIINSERQVGNSAAKVQHDLALPLGVALAVVDQVVVYLHHVLDVAEH